MAHKVSIRNGMTSSDEKALSNLAVSFISTGGGVVGTNDYLVAAQGSPNNTVLIGTGKAYTPTSDATMMYSSVLDATQNVTIGANASGNPRIDTIVLYIDLSASPDSTATNVAKFFDVQGTPAGSPAAPNNAAILAAIGASNPYIKLANIAVANGFTSINSGNITDQRATAAFTTGQSVPVITYAEFTDQGAAAAAPASGKTRVYTKGGALFSIVNGGTATQLGSSTVVANGSQTTSFTVDWSKGNTQTITLTSASFTFTFTNPTPGMHLTLEVAQDASGNRGTTLAFPGTVKWSNGVAPILSTTASKIDLLGFIWDGTQYLGFTSLGY